MFLALAAAVAIGQVISPPPLPDLDGNLHKIETSKSAATVIVFVSADCPISLEYGDRLSALSTHFASKGVRFIALAPNFNESDSAVRQMVQEGGLSFPVYRDPGAKLAGMVGARMTPVAVVLDRAGRLRYRGQIDDARNPARVKRETLGLAVETILSGHEIGEPETRSLGCAIKREDR